MIRRPPRSTRTGTRFPDTTHCRSRHDDAAVGDVVVHVGQREALASEIARFARQRQLNDFEGSAPGIARLLQPREEIGKHTSELQSLMRISSAVFCLHKTKPQPTTTKSTALFFIHTNTSP